MYAAKNVMSSMSLIYNKLVFIVDAKAYHRDNHLLIVIVFLKTARVFYSPINKASYFVLNTQVKFLICTALIANKICVLNAANKKNMLSTN